MDSSKDWANLPTDLLNFILLKFNNFLDFLRFCSVCQEWRYIGLNSNTSHRQNLQILRTSHNKLPMLVIQTKENNAGARSMFSFTDGLTYDFKLQRSYEYRFCGSSLGWLFAVDKTMAISLVNPLTRGNILLPVFDEPKFVFEELWNEEFHDYYIYKGLLTASPSLNLDDYTVVVKYSGWGKLALYKPGYNSWKRIELKSRQISDFIYYNDHVYGITLRNTLIKIEVNSEIVKTVIRRKPIASEPVTDIARSRHEAAYLVESQDGALLQIQRFWKVDLDRDDYLVKTIMFKVFKLVDNENSLAKWDELYDLGEQAVFVGDNQSVSVSTKEFPQCRGNCIYFTDAHHSVTPPYRYRGLELEDSGVFDLKDGSVHTHYSHQDSSQKHMLPPLWFVPKLD